MQRSVDRTDPVTINVSSFPVRETATRATDKEMDLIMTVMKSDYLWFTFFRDPASMCA
jgi:hypothetical protein